MDREMGTSLDAYMASIKDVEPPTREEHVLLARRVRLGAAASEELSVTRSARKRTLLEKQVADGLLAREEMISRNVKLVIHVSKKFISTGIPFEDLIEEGNIALVRAVDGYNPETGNAFSSYAVQVIKSQLIRVSRVNSSVMRVPEGAGQDIYGLQKAESALRDKLNREPTYQELADVLMWGVSKVARMKEASFKAASLSAPVGDDGELLDMLADKSPAPENTAYVSDIFDALLTSLPDQHAQVVRRLYGFDTGTPEPRKDVRGDLGLSGHRLATVEAEAIAMLRHPSRASLLSDLVA